MPITAARLAPLGRGVKVTESLLRHRARQLNIRRDESTFRVQARFGSDALLRQLRFRGKECAALEREPGRLRRQLRRISLRSQSEERLRGRARCLVYIKGAHQLTCGVLIEIAGELRACLLSHDFALV